jgi:hypothetical protein
MVDARGQRGTITVPRMVHGVPSGVENVSMAGRAETAPLFTARTSDSHPVRCQGVEKSRTTTHMERQRAGSAQTQGCLFRSGLKRLLDPSGATGYVLVHSTIRLRKEGP